MSVPLVRVVRSGLVESSHAGDVALVDHEGGLVASAGDPDRVLFARSSMKPLQATVSLSLGEIDATDGEVAVMCASHNAEPVHVETVRSILGRGGVAESDLRTPMRAGATDDDLAARWVIAMAGKAAGHGIDDPTFLQPSRPMSAIGG